MKGLSIIIGTYVLMCFVNLFLINNPVEVVYANGEVVPEQIEIEKINLKKQIVPGIIKGNNWQINANNVNYLVGSGNLNEGNLVLYAHKKWGLFENLRKLKKGDLIELSSGKVIRDYEVIDSKQVRAEDVSILQDEGESKLTLFTCDGPFDMKRWVVVGKQVSR